MSSTHMYHDPNYRQGEAYEYGDVRDITLTVNIGDSILWACTYKQNGKITGCGGFTGPFEALAYALAACKKHSEKQSG